MKKIVSLRTKIIIILIPLLLIGFSMLSIISYKVASASFKQSNLELMKEMCNTASSKTSDRINSELNSLQVIASNPAMWDNSISKEEKIELLKPVAKILDVLNISIGDVEGEFIDTNGNIHQSKTSQSYLNPMAGKSSISNPYIDPENKLLVVSYSVPIFNENNEIVGIIAALKECSTFASLLDEIKFLDSGSLMIVDSYGNFIVTNDEDLKGNNITNIKSEKEDYSSLNNLGKAMINSQKTEVKQYMYKGISKYMAFTPISDSELFLGISVDESEFFKFLANLKYMNIIITIIMILIISSMCIIFFICICKRLISAKDYVDTMAEGDFKSEIDSEYLEGNDEIDSICASISEAKKSIGSMICSVKNNADDVKDEANDLNEISSNLVRYINEIKASMESVSGNANRQYSEFYSITETLNGFSDNFDTIQKNVNSIDKRVKIVNSKANDGNKNIEKLNEKIINVNTSFKVFCESLDKVEGQMDIINSITKIINDISEQTNLLALNASIEATRAGKEGQGFNIVANEISDLADQSKKSAQDICNTINYLIEIVRETVKESNLMKMHIEEQKNIIYEALDSFAQITILVKEIAPKISNINSSFNDITVNKNEIVQTIEDLSDQVKVTSQSLEQVVLSADNMSVLSENVSGNSDVLVVRAEKLLKEVEKFKV